MKPNSDAIQLPRDFFPVLAWDPLHGWKEPYVDHRHGLESMAECHFTMGSFVLPKDLPLCEELGLKVLLFTEDSKAWKGLSDDAIDGKVKDMVERAGDSPAILGYDITDEPGATAFPALAKAVAAVKKYAPGKLAYINLFPGYATIGAPDQSQLETGSFTEYLERFVAEVKPQFLSYDDYMVQYSNDLKDSDRVSRYFADLIEVRRVAREHGLPFWNIVSSNQIRPFTTVPAPANLLFQAYTTLAAGGRGVTWYTYYSRGYGYAPIDAEENRTATWQYLQLVNRQLKVVGPVINGLESTGVFFTSPPIVEGLPVLPGELAAAVQCDTAVMVGEFNDQDGAPYVMAVNLSLERSAKPTFEWQDGLRCAGVLSPEEGTFGPLEEDESLWLVAGQGALIRLARE